MAQWIAIGVTLLFALVAGCIAYGKLVKSVDILKAEVINLQQEAQSPEERAALEKLIDERFRSHEQLDDLRFETLTKTIDGKLDKILTAVNNHRSV